MQERLDETGVGATIEVAARRERQRRIERDDDDGDDDDGENDDQTINSKSTFRPPLSRKDTINLFRMRPGSKAALSAPWLACFNRVETGIEYLVW